MMTDERNFRLTYYEKVGFKSVEEKKSLDILLDEDHLDESKLKAFCLGYVVPVDYKNIVWKLLLEIVPNHTICRKFVSDQQIETYRNLVHALNIMKVTNNITIRQKLFLSVWLLHTGKLHLFYPNIRDQTTFSAIVATVMFFFNKDEDIYWVSKAFYDLTRKFQVEYQDFLKETYLLLEKEDAELYQLFSDRNSIALDSFLPLRDWYDCCFAGILHEIALGKIWDKICCGCYKIVVYVTVVLLITLRCSISQARTDSLTVVSLTQINQMITEEVSDMIVTKSIELWQKHGRPFVISDRISISSSISKS